MRSRERTRVCTHCGVFLDPSDTQCFNCGTTVAVVHKSNFSTWIKENFELQGEVTRGILLTNVLLFVLTWIISASQGKSDLLLDVDLKVLVGFGAKTGQIFQGEIWRLITAMFLHANFLHIFFNMWAFIQLGHLVEDLYGWKRYVFFYIASGAIGYVASATFYPEVVSIGASGGIMGLFGVLLAYSARNWRTHGKQLGKRLLVPVAIVLGYGLLIPLIDNSAHLGGLLSGFLLALPFQPEPPRSKFSKILENILGWSTIVLVLLSFLAMGFSR